MRLTQCQCRHWWCWLDSTLHRIGVTWYAVCDRHERVIRR